MSSISSYKLNTFTVNDEKQYQWALKFCYVAECSLVICLLVINAWKHIYLTVLIVSVINTQKHLVVTSDFCMFHRKIIEGWLNFSFLLLAKLWLNLFSEKRLLNQLVVSKITKWRRMGWQTPSIDDFMIVTARTPIQNSHFFFCQKCLTREREVVDAV